MRGLAALPLARITVITAALLCGCASSASGQASPGVDAASRVDLVLERGRFLEPLPFDVQFYLYGDAPADLVYAQGRYARLTRQLRKCEPSSSSPKGPLVGRGPDGNDM